MNRIALFIFSFFILFSDNLYAADEGAPHPELSVPDLLRAASEPAEYGPWRLEHIEAFLKYAYSNCETASAKHLVDESRVRFLDRFCFYLGRTYTLDPALLDEEQKSIRDAVLEHWYEGDIPTEEALHTMHRILDEIRRQKDATIDCMSDALDPEDSTETLLAEMAQASSTFIKEMISN